MPSKPEFSDYEPLTKKRAKISNEEASNESWVVPGGRHSERGVETEEFSPRSSSSLTSGPKAYNGSISQSLNATGERVQSLDVVSPRTAPPVGIIKDQGRESSNDTWILKRGHAFSFLGLFLFTFVLYFRPYEFFPALT